MAGGMYRWWRKTGASNFSDIVAFLWGFYKDGWSGEPVRWERTSRGWYTNPREILKKSMILVIEILKKRMIYAF